MGWPRAAGDGRIGNGRSAWRAWCWWLGLLGASPAAWAGQPNIVLIMADDLGWGDVGYNGNPIVKTPELDRWAREGLRLDRFYSGAPVCTPTRASALTGRNATRTGVVTPSQYPFPREEISIASYLREAGYTTGFFGKWHLGKLTPEGDEVFANRQPSKGQYGAPWHFGFDTVFAAEISVPTYNPAVWDFNWGDNIPETEKKMVMDRPLRLGEGTSFGLPMAKWSYDFWRGEGRRYEKVPVGDSSRLVADEANDFIRKSAGEKQPFLAVIWFFAPHSPLAAGVEDRAPYAHLPIRAQHAYGTVTAMDRAIATVRQTLRDVGVSGNTLVLFCSDNGPSWVHEFNSAGHFRGQKADLFEGGIRVPALVEWPDRLPGGRVIEAPISTDDFLPTLLAAVGVPLRDRRPIDGTNVLPLLQGKTTRRSAPLFFESVVRNEGAATTEAMFSVLGQYAMIDGPWKLLSRDGGRGYQLYHLEKDPAESLDLASSHPERVSEMRRALTHWRESCAASLAGRDYR